MKGCRWGRGRWMAVAGLLGVMVGLRAGAAQKAETTTQKAQTQTTETPTMHEILQRLQENLEQYDSGVPSFFADEHVVSRMVPDVHDQETVTDSVFRLKRTPHPDHTTTLEESREVKTVNGQPATKQ